MNKPSIGELMAAIGISKTYASDILASRQDPSRPLAIHIYRRTGWRADCIVDLTEEQIGVLEQIEPWQPRTTQDEAA